MDDDELVCARCHLDYSLRAGHEPTRYCDPCAHEKVDELETRLAQVVVLLAERELYEGTHNKDDAMCIEAIVRVVRGE